MFRVKTILTGLPGLPGVSTLYFDSTGGLLAADAADAVGDFWASFAGGLAGALRWDLDQEVEVVDHATGQIQQIVTVAARGGQGGISTSEPLPHTTQGLLRFKTDAFANGRRIQGRIFIPGFTEADSASGQPNSGTVLLLNNAGLVLMNHALSSLVVYSRTNANFAVVTVVSGWNQWAVLRSRRPEQI